MSLALIQMPLMGQPISSATTTPEPTYKPLNEVNEVVLAYVFTGSCRLFNQNNEQVLSVYRDDDTYELYEIATGNKIFASPAGLKLISPDRRYMILEDGVYGFPDGGRLFSLSIASRTIQFSPDSHFLTVDGDGVYSIPDGERVFSAPLHGMMQFSPDSLYLFIQSEGLYSIADWKKRFDVLPAINTALFSPDNTLMAVSNDGVYEIETGKKLLEFPDRSAYPRFSSDGTWLSVSKAGVYEVATWEKRFDYQGGKKEGQFSPDSQFLLIYPNDGLYELNSQQQIASIEGEYFLRSFSPDGQLLALSENGVYNISTGERLFSITGYLFGFSPDSKLLAVDDDAIYEIPSGRKLFHPLGGEFTFSQDNSILLASRIINLPDQWEYEEERGCLIYGDVDRFKPYSFGLVFADGDFVYSAPSKDSETTGYIRRYGGLLVVDGQTRSHDWYKVKDVDGWLNAKEFRLAYSPPQGLPEIEP